MRRVLWSIIAVGFVGRVVLAFKTYGVAYDIDSLKSVRDALAAHRLHVYSAVNAGRVNHWPYPPGFFPWIVVAGGLYDAPPDTATLERLRDFYAPHNRRFFELSGRTFDW